MRIAYVHLPRFPVQRRLAETPSLVGRAFVLIHDVRGHQRVAFVSPAAQRAGARAGMTVTEATALCPDLLSLPYLEPTEAAALASLGEALLALGPAFQAVAPDGLWLDASAAKLFAVRPGETARAESTGATSGGSGAAGAARAESTGATSSGSRAGASMEARAGVAVTGSTPGGAKLAGRSHSDPAKPETPSAPRAPPSASKGSSAPAGAFACGGSTAPGGSTGGSTAPAGALETGFIARVVELCRAHGYECRVAVADDLFTARAVARHGAAPVAIVSPGGSRAALTRLPLAALDGAAEPLAAPLRSLGLTTLGEVAALPSGAVVARLGSSGLWLHQLCRGEDDALLVPAPVTEVLEEAIALDWPAESVEPLLFALKTALDRLCARLSGTQRAAVKLTLTLRLDPSGERRLPLTLARPTALSKLLLDLTKHRISDLTLENPVAGLMVRVDEACLDRGQQLGLGDGPQGDAALEVVLARLSTALGEEALFSAEVAAWHRPEGAYAPRPFRPFGAGGSGEQAASSSGLLADLPRERSTTTARPAGDDTQRERPARLFAQAAALDAYVDERGALCAARVLGKRREVTALYGPERLCGEWWGNEPYSRDYFRVHFDGLGPAWVYRDALDGRFYLHGMFD